MVRFMCTTEGGEGGGAYSETTDCVADGVCDTAENAAWNARG